MPGNDRRRKMDAKGNAAPEHPGAAFIYDCTLNCFTG